MINKITSLIFAFILVFSINSNLFIVHIVVPLGNIPFPYLFWILIFIYTAVHFKLLKLPLNISFISKSILFGLFFHIILLLIKLKNEESVGLINFSSNVYKAYFTFFTIFLFSSITAFVTYKVLTYRIHEAGESIYNMPLLGLWLYLFSSTFNQRQYGQLFLFTLIFILTALLITNRDYFERFKNLSLKFKGFILDPKIFLPLVFIGALTTRTIYLLRTMTNPNYLLTGADAYNYDRLARMYLGTGIPLVESLPLLEIWNWLAHLGSWQYVALFYKIFDYSYFAFCFVQGILGAISCIFVYFIARYVFNEIVARIATVLAMLNFSMVFSSIAIDNMGLNIFCTTAAIFLLCKYRESNLANNSHIALFAFIGLVIGLLIMTFYTNIIFLLIILIWLFLLDMNVKKAGIKKSLIHTGLVILFSASVISLSLFLFGLNNIKSFTASLFSNFPDTKRFYSGYFAGKEFTKFPEMISLGLGSATEIILYSVPVILEKGFPAFNIILKFFTKSFSDLFFSQGYGGFDPIFLVRTSDYFYGLWFYAYALTIFGIIAAIFKRNLYQNSMVRWLLYLYIIYTTSIHILFFRAEYRYRALMEPYLIIFGSFGLWTLYQNTKRRQKT